MRGLIGKTKSMKTDKPPAHNLGQTESMKTDKPSAHNPVYMQSFAFQNTIWSDEGTYL